MEKTFKSVDQSQKEYEMERQPLLSTILKKRPIRNTLGNKASSSAVLAAVSAGQCSVILSLFYDIKKIVM